MVTALGARVLAAGQVGLDQPEQIAAWISVGLLAVAVAGEAALPAARQWRAGISRALAVVRAVLFASLAVASVLVILELRARRIGLPCVVWLPVPVCLALAWLSLLRPAAGGSTGTSDIGGHGPTG